MLFSFTFLKMGSSATRDTKLHVRIHAASGNVHLRGDNSAAGRLRNEQGLAVRAAVGQICGHAAAGAGSDAVHRLAVRVEQPNAAQTWMGHREVALFVDR